MKLSCTADVFIKANVENRPNFLLRISTLFAKNTQKNSPVLQAQNKKKKKQAKGTKLLVGTQPIARSLIWSLRLKKEKKRLLLRRLLTNWYTHFKMLSSMAARSCSCSISVTSLHTKISKSINICTQYSVLGMRASNEYRQGYDKCRLMTKTAVKITKFCFFFSWKKGEGGGEWLSTETQ